MAGDIRTEVDLDSSDSWPPRPAAGPTLRGSPRNEPFGDLEGLWEQLGVFTGDGHGIGGDLGYCYSVTVVASPWCAELVGKSSEWVGFVSGLSWRVCSAGLGPWGCGVGRSPVPLVVVSMAG